ncbi:hypothetical protein WJX84_005781 [Apatococcus fuscideae]|uniref:Uncharacterized protein n=1 Tax=Apatococcus fuscideae TaxID=2026836 RepID=A0AAW1SKP5_9CHLO
MSAPLMSVIPGTIGGMGVAWVVYHAITEWKLFGGSHPADQLSWQPKHKIEEMKRFMSMEREADPDNPVFMNPFRHNIPATIRNASELPGFEPLEEDEE